MPLVMLLIFIAVPLLELALLIWIGKSIGLLLTIGLVVLDMAGTTESKPFGNSPIRAVLSTLIRTRSHRILPRHTAT